MDGDKLLRAIYDQFSDRMQPDLSVREEMRDEMITILESKDYFVAKDDAELRKLALEYTDLVEPSDE